jgi:uncharacterized protein (TIGR04255 family)
LEEQFRLAGGDRQHNFRSNDEVWTVGLTKDFLALSTKTYSTWTEFGERLARPFDALLQHYVPSVFNRVGLRYRDRIRRSRLGIDPMVPWSELLTPPFAGELADAILGEHVIGASRQVTFKLPDELGSVQMRHGLSDEEGEQCFIVDTDFFTSEQLGAVHARERLDVFNKLSGRLFRHCLQPALYSALGPQNPS